MANKRGIRKTLEILTCFECRAKIIKKDMATIEYLEQGGYQGFCKRCFKKEEVQNGS